MHCVGRHGEHGPGREAVLEDGDAGTRGHDAGEAERGGAVDAQGLGDYGVQTGVVLVVKL